MFFEKTKDAVERAIYVSYRVVGETVGKGCECLIIINTNTCC